MQGQNKKHALKTASAQKQRATKNISFWLFESSEFSRRAPNCESLLYNPLPMFNFDMETKEPDDPLCVCLFYSWGMKTNLQ